MNDHGRQARLGVVAGLVLVFFGAADLRAPRADEESLAAWERCRRRTERLGRAIDSLMALEIATWEQRRAAIAGAHRSDELRALARGEALADSLRARARAWQASAHECDRLGEQLLAALDHAPAATDSVQRLRGALLAGRSMERPIDLTPPVAEPEDPPDVVRVKALRARDLADLAEAWRTDVAAVLTAREQRLRLEREQRALRGDLEFFGPGGALETGGEEPIDPWEEARIVEQGTGVGRLLEAWLAREGTGVAPRTQQRALAALEAWLRDRRAELETRAAQLDSLVATWEGRP